MSNQTISRISKELGDIQKGNDLSIAVGFQESDIRHVRALIIGPPDTPYQNGFFEFSVKFPSDYPQSPPKVDAKTTNGGRCRFNPNIYAGGKVCLSILGTWRGEKGEEWSSAQGLESVLISIQSLMSNNPYQNEPGYENANSSDEQRTNEKYCAKIRHETLRIAVVQKLEDSLGIMPDGSIETGSPKKWIDENEEDDPEEGENQAQIEARIKFEPFKDLYKRRFLWYYESYFATVQDNMNKWKDGVKFDTMPFEHEGNTMVGTFKYAELGKKLIRIKEAINAETARWATTTLSAISRETVKANNLQRMWSKFSDSQKAGGIPNISVELEDNNPSVWLLTYFGRPGTSLEGGIFKIRIAISLDFPDEQPRVKVETPIYHHCVSPDGILCYFPNPRKLGDMGHHVQAIVDVLEDESPPYDPRAIVHPDASKLCFGSAEDRRKYKRQVRRSAQRSVEDEC